jgi:hypothetical protein
MKERKTCILVKLMHVIKNFYVIYLGRFFFMLQYSFVVVNTRDDKTPGV